MTLEIIKDVHEGVGQSTHPKALAFHKGRYSAYPKISERFFWYSIYICIIYIKITAQKK